MDGTLIWDFTEYFRRALEWLLFGDFWVCVNNVIKDLTDETCVIPYFPYCQRQACFYLATSHALSLKEKSKKTNHECIVLFCLKIANYFPLKPGHCSF